MIDFADTKLMFWIIKKKLDDIHDDINYAFNQAKNETNSRCYWREPSIWTLSNLEAKITSARNIATSYLRKAEKGDKHGLLR